MSLTLSTEIFSVDRGQTCRIGCQWHKHRRYKHLWRRGNRIERFRGFLELTVAPSQKLCLKFKTSRPCGNRPPGLTLHLSFVQFVHSTRKCGKYCSIRSSSDFNYHRPGTPDEPAGNVSYMAVKTALTTAENASQRMICSALNTGPSTQVRR